MHRVPYIVTLGIVDGRVSVCPRKKGNGRRHGREEVANIARVIEYQDKYLPATVHVELWLSETRCQLQIIKLPYSTLYFAQSPGRDIGYVCDSGSLTV